MVITLTVTLPFGVFPPMQPLLSWLRTNLPLAVFLCSLLSAALGAMMTTASFVVDMQHVTVERGLMLGTHTRQIDDLHRAMIDVDHRLNDQKSYVEELRRTRDGQDAVLNERIAVLEAQLRFFADRTSIPQPLGNRR
jgi:hypothetical protein